MFIYFYLPGEEDFTDTDSVMTGADSPELSDSVPDKDKLRYTIYDTIYMRY